MAKNYAKFVPPKSRTSKRKKWRPQLIAAIFFVVAGATALGGFLYVKSAPGIAANSQNISSLFSKLALLVHHKKINVVPAPVVAKTALASTDGQSPPVHFDFYDELPNMQMPPDESQSSASAPKREPSPIPPADAPAIAKAATPPSVAPVSVAMVTNVKPTESQPVVKNPPLVSPAAPAPIFNSSEISDLIAAEQGVPRAVPNAPHYFIQIEVFQSEQAANRLREAIVSVGFEAVVVKVKQGNHKVYQVQQGPYESAALAKVSQQRLEKRGITSVIQKTSA